MLHDDSQNGINAFMAHTARVGDDNNFVRSLVEGYDFLGFGTVISYANERVKVSCGGRVFTNVEVVVIGIDGWGIKPVPAPKDRVLLFSTQIPVADLKTFKASGSMPAYDVSGLKAIPITDSSTKQLLTVSKNGVVLTGNNKVTINDAGIQVEDKNQNKLKTSNTGVEVEDGFHNKFSSNGQGTIFEDKFHNKLQTQELGIKFTDAQGNTVTTDNQALEIKGSHSNGGQHNTITMSSSGLYINDIKGNTITCDQNGVVINSNFKVLR